MKKNLASVIALSAGLSTGPSISLDDWSCFFILDTEAKILVVELLHPAREIFYAIEFETMKEKMAVVVRGSVLCVCHPQDWISESSTKDDQPIDGLLESLEWSR